MSFEKSAGFLNDMLGKDVEGFVTIWRDVQRFGEKLRRRKIVNPRLKATVKVVVGLDGTYVRLNGKTQPVMVAIDKKMGP